MIIVRALYGLKSSRAAWNEHFANTLYDMDFKPSYADPNVWMRAAVKPNGFKYYEYIFVYVDDLLILSHLTKAIVRLLKSIYCLKDDKVGAPKTYLANTLYDMDFKPSYADPNVWTRAAVKPNGFKYYE
jgi:hypothetical protein